jgi:hypothetical protein
LFAFPDKESASVLDPCAGTGTALHLLTAGADVEKHGIDANRAEVAAASGIRMVHGNAFDTVGKAGSFSFLYLNPPYDFEIGPMSNKRMEYLFLDHTYHLLVEGGVLLMVVPEDKLDSSIPLLAGNFVKLQVFSLSDPESERFKQVAVLGVRKRVRGQDYEQNRAFLQRLIYRLDMPVLQGGEMVYSMPPTPSYSLYGAALSRVAPRCNRRPASQLFGMEASQGLSDASRRNCRRTPNHAAPCRPCRSAGHRGDAQWGIRCREGQTHCALALH